MTHAQPAPSRRAHRARRGLWLLLLLAVVLVNAIPYRRLVNIDDAYISYRYAQNLLQHGEMVYNLAGDKAFAATAPGYVTLLAALSAPGISTDLVGYALGVLAIWLAAAALLDLLRRWSLGAGVGAGLLLALLPVPWLVIGMESVLVMALVLLAYALTLRGRQMLAALLLIGATALRFDAAAAAAVWGLYLLLTLRLKAWRPIALYGIGAAAFYTLMWLILDVPLPTTLASKQAQVALGVTGFGPHTTYLSGFGLLAQAHIEQSPLYWVALGLALVGAMGAVALLFTRTSRESDRPETSRRIDLLAPLALIAGWSILHVAAYLILGVTPYLWYYLPFFPLLAALVAAGITLIARAVGRLGPVERRNRWATGVAAALWLLALAGPVASHLAIRSSQPELGGGRQPITNDLLLPGTHWGPYRTIGERLAADTPPDASAGMMEIGIIGYYSGRPVVDFLGLLDTDIAAALTRGDIAWALHAQQPDYVVLGKGYPLYSYNVYQSRWFQTTYAPKWQVMNRVPEGNWFTVYERKAPRPLHGPVDALPPTAEPLNIRFGDTFELVGFDMPVGTGEAVSPLRPEDPAGVTLYWRSLRAPEKDYTLFVHLLDSRGALIAGRDAPPLLGERPTSQWQAGELLADFHPLGLPPMPLAPTDLRLEVGFYDADGARLPAFGPDGAELPGGQAQFGRGELLPATQPLRFGMGEPGNVAHLAIGSYELEQPFLTRGAAQQLTLQVTAADGPLMLTAELWDEPGQRVIAQGSAPADRPGEYALQLKVEPGEPASQAQLRLRAKRDGVALAWIDEAGHAIDQFAPLTPLSLR